MANLGKITRGANCYFGPSASIYVPEYLSLGENIAIGSNWVVQTNLTIGNNSLISSNVSFIGNDHDIFDRRNTAYSSGRLKPALITLQGDNFVGFGATLLGSITVGEGAVIGACSLVLNDVPAWAIVAGVPAKVIGTRDETTK